MRHPPNKWAPLVSVGIGLVAACHQPCEYGSIVPQGTRFKATVTGPSTDCPETVPLKAGDVLTFAAGPVAEAECRGNVSSGLPPEFPRYPDVPYRIDHCTEGIGIGRFECIATAPDCVTGGVEGTGRVRGGFTLSRYPDQGEALGSELRVTVSVGDDPSCSSECLTNIPVSVERL